MSNSHDGFPVGSAVGRSLHLEEYSRSRPASAGSRPRSLLNKVANAAAAAQADEDPEPADAEPWVLEGWGDGPSVSEAAQQAALRLAPHFKNVPTTLVGLGGGPGGRRVLSAGPQGRSPLKASEARRKPASGPPILQSDRRAAAAAARRAPPPRDLEVGDESDVEPEPAPAARAAPAGPGPTTGYGQPAGYGSPGPARLPPTQRTGPGIPSPSRLPGGSAPLTQGPPGAAARLARRDGPAGAAAQQPPGPAVRNPSPRSPHYRGLSTEAVSTAGQAGSPGLGRGNSGTQRAPPVPPVPHAASGAPLLPPHGHLDPILPVGGRAISDPVGGPLDLRYGRSSSGGMGDPGEPPTASAPTAPNSARSDVILSHGLFPGQQHLPSPTATQAGSPVRVRQPLPPALPGLSACRRVSTSRAETGLSGWDPEAPAMPLLQPHSSVPVASSPYSLWVGPSAPGAGLAGLQVTGVPPSRGNSVSGGPQQRREQAAANTRLHRGGGAAPATALDLSLMPERSPERSALSGAQPGQGPPSGRTHGRPVGPAPGPQPLLAQRPHSHGTAAAATTMSAAAEADGAGGVAGFGPPQQDALTEFCASRSELGSGGGLPSSGSGRMQGLGPGPGGGLLETRVPSQRRNSLTGLVPTPPELGPMRVGSLTRATTAVGRVS